MVLAAWEIACLVIAILALTSATLYILLRRYLLSKSKSKKTEEKPERNPRKWVTNASKANLDVTMVYGVPYSLPSPRPPHSLDPAKLEAMVSKGTELHPKYLQYKDGLGDISEHSVDASLDHRVVWNGDSVLLESEFGPSITESLAGLIDVHRSSPAILSTSPRMKRIIHIDYGRGTDGAPVIHDMSTVTIAAEGLETIRSKVSTSDYNFKDSTPIGGHIAEKKTTTSCTDVINDVTHADHVIIEPTNEKTLLKAPRGRWVQFDEDIPSVIVQDENGFIRQRLEFDT